MNDYFAEIFNAANEGMYVTDRERRFLLWNEAAERTTGYGKKELIGRFCYDNILQHVDQEGRPLCTDRCPLQAAIEKGAHQGPEIVFLRHRSGKRIAVEVNTAPIRNGSGDIIGGVEVFQDVTERLERERLLQERKEKLEAVLDGIGEGILFLDTAGTVSMINRAFATMFSLSISAETAPPESLTDKAPALQVLSRVEELYWRSTALALDRPVERCPEGRGLFRCWTAAIDRTTFAPRSRCFSCVTYRSVRTFLERPRELMLSDRSISVVSSFLEFPETNELREVIVCHDVTADKLDAALKVAGAAAHELRQPLQVIVIAAELLKKQLRRNKTNKKNIDMLIGSCDRMDAIIEKMTALSDYRTKEYIGGESILDISQSHREK